MNVSLIIPAYNEEGYIGRCLESVMRHEGGRFREIIVVDNASSDKTAEIARRFEGVRVIREDKKGLTHARQAGFDASSGEFVAYIDADCLLRDGWLETALRVFKDRADIVSVSGPVRYHDAPYYIQFIMRFLWYLTVPATYQTVGYMLIGGNFIARRSAIEKIGGFDREIAFYGEDTDLARRLSAVGKTVFRMDFFIYTSGRRFMHEGIVSTNARYAFNFAWPFRRRFSKHYTDVR